MLLNELLIASHWDWICANADGHYDLTGILNILFFLQKGFIVKQFIQIEVTYLTQAVRRIKPRVPYPDLYLRGKGMI